MIDVTGLPPLLRPADLGRLRDALTGFTVDAVHQVLGPIGQAAHDRGDLAGVARVLRAAGDDPLATLIRLFLLGRAVPESEAWTALDPLPPDAALEAGLIARDGDRVRAQVEIRPYAQAATSAAGVATDAPPWWVVSDFGSDVRPGPLAADHVLGIGSASLTLAQLTPRDPVGRALDLGTGSGVQALHLSAHASSVTATDVSARALRFAATTAALSGVDWRLLQGSLGEPVAGERFDLVVANPPFVVSAGDPTTAGYDYRDSGMSGDAVSQALLSGLPGLLADAGTAVLLANWIMPPDGDWQGRLAGWLAASTCHAWVWQREVADPGEYVSLWLRDAGETPGSPRWIERYDAWTGWFEQHGIAAVGMGSVALWASGDGERPIREFEDVPQALGQPVGAELPAWLARRRWLAGIDDTTLLRAGLHTAPDLVLDRHDVLDPAAGWSTAAQSLRQSHGMRWEVEVDDAVAGAVAAVAAGHPLSAAVAVLSASTGASAGEVATALAPVARDLIGRGFLVPDAVRPVRPSPAMRVGAQGRPA